MLWSTCLVPTCFLTVIYLSSLLCYCSILFQVYSWILCSELSTSAQIFEIVNLANELLPPLPQGTISLPSSSSVCVKGSLINVPPVDSEELVASEEQVDSIGTEISTREKLLNEQPELLQQFGMDILPVLIQVNS